MQNIRLRYLVLLRRRGMAENLRLAMNVDFAGGASTLRGRKDHPRTQTRTTPNGSPLIPLPSLPPSDQLGPPVHALCTTPSDAWMERLHLAEPVSTTRTPSSLSLWPAYIVQVCNILPEVLRLHTFDPCDPSPLCSYAIFTMSQYLTLTMHCVTAIVRDDPQVMDPEDRVYNKAIRRPPPAVSHPSSASGDPFGDGSYTAFSRDNLEEVKNYTARLFAPRNTTAYAPVRLRFVGDLINPRTSSSEDRIFITGAWRDSGEPGDTQPRNLPKAGEPVVYLKDTWQRDSATPKAGRTVLPTPFRPATPPPPSLVPPADPWKSQRASNPTQRLPSPVNRGPPGQMANQQQPPINLSAAPAHPQQAVAAPPHAPGRENIPPIPTTPPHPLARLPLRPRWELITASSVDTSTTSNHNGYLTPHTAYGLPQNADLPDTASEWPFRGLEGPLLRTRIEGNDELVFGPV
ncbi:hypothetical protein VTO73DRAFT_11184 [Trametes versicolor]